MSGQCRHLNFSAGLGQQSLIQVNDTGGTMKHECSSLVGKGRSKPA
jgi:hypothetical protein